MTTKAVLGADLSFTATGLVVVKGNQVKHRQVVKTPGPHKASDQERIDIILREVLTLADKVDLTVIEGPGYSQVSITSFKLGMLTGVVTYMMWSLGHRFVMPKSSAIKLFATGKGNASKEQMVVAAQPYFETKDHNEADALFLALWGVEMYDSLVSK